MALALALALAHPAAAVSLFQVGNSLTWDTNLPGTEAMLESLVGEGFDVGYHIRGNTTLRALWDQPTASGTGVSRFGSHPTALPNNHWDFLTLQSFPSSELPTIDLETARIRDFVASADRGSGGATEVIVYGPFAGRDDSLWANWDAPLADGSPILAGYSAAYHDLLFDRVEELFPGRVRLASNGKVFHEVRRLIDGGELPIASSDLLYRDTIHLSKLGSFIASTTIVASVSGMNPEGVPVPRDVWPESEVSDDLAIELQRLVWRVMVGDPRSRVDAPGDLNRDQSVDDRDRGAWAAAFGARSNPTADPNGDGVVDELDGRLWLDELTPGPVDANADGRVDEQDRQAWGAAYGSPGGSPSDFNADGSVDAADYTVWRDNVAARRRVDFNRDGAVNQADGAIWLAQLGWARDLPADANGDGVVNAADYTVWRDALQANSASGGAAVPEPAAWGFAAGAVVALGRRRCRPFHKISGNAR